MSISERYALLKQVQDAQRDPRVPEETKKLVGLLWRKFEEKERDSEMASWRNQVDNLRAHDSEYGWK